MTDLELSQLGLVRRWLSPEEYARPDLRAIFHTEGSATPLPNMSRIAVIEEIETSTIVALCTFQLAAHAEPLWTHPDHRGKKLAQAVGALVDDFLTTGEVSAVFTLPSQEVSQHLAKKFGFTHYSDAYIKYYSPITHSED